MASAIINSLHDKNLKYFLYDGPAAKEWPHFALLNLPSGAVLHVVSLLPLQDQARVMCVCSKLKDVTQGVLEGRKSLSLKFIQVTEDDLAKHFCFGSAHCRRLEELVVDIGIGVDIAPEVADDGVAFYQVWPRGRPGRHQLPLVALFSSAAATLSRVELINSDARDEELAALGHWCKGLRSLTVGVRFNVEDRPRPPWNPAMMSCCAVTDRGFAAVADGCPRLESLSLLHCNALTNSSLQRLAKARPPLRALALHGCGYMTARGLVAVLEAAPGLRDLDIMDCGDKVWWVTGSNKASTSGRFDATVCAALAEHCAGLTGLSFHQTQFTTPPSGVDDDALSLVARSCPELRSLSLSGVRAGDPLLAEVAAGCTKLRRLVLDRTLAGDYGIGRVAVRCGELRELSVSGHLLAGEALWRMVQQPQGVQDAGLSESGIWQVSCNCGSLTSLRLSSLIALDDGKWIAGSEGASGGRGAVDGPGWAGLVAGLDAGRGPFGRWWRGCAAARPPPPARLVLSPSLCCRLVELSIDDMAVAPDHGGMVAALECCCRLERLSLASHRGPTDELLSALCRARAPLSVAVLRLSSVTDAGLEAVAGSFQGTLSHLNLSGCSQEGITDAGLGAIRRLRALEGLDITHVTNVTTNGVAELIRTHPSLRQLVIDRFTCAGRCVWPQLNHQKVIFSAADARKEVVVTIAKGRYTYYHY